MVRIYEHHLESNFRGHPLCFHRHGQWLCWLYYSTLPGWKVTWSKQKVAEGVGLALHTCNTHIVHHPIYILKLYCYTKILNSNKIAPSWSPMLYLRKLRKAVERYMPDPATIQEEQELVPGGDIRILGNAWLRKAWPLGSPGKQSSVSWFAYLLNNIPFASWLSISNN